MKFIIYKPTGKEEFAVSWLEVNTPVGNLVIQKGHIPTLLSILPNKPITLMLKNGKEESFISQGGILHITREEVFFISQ